MRVLATAIATLSLTACTVGPNYRRPLVVTPPQWAASQARGTQSVTIDADRWWQSFQDAELDSLIQRAVAANYDLALATARVEEARGSLGVVRASLSPQVNAGASVTRDRQVGAGLLQQPGGVSVRQFPFEANDFQGDASLSWELDLFGRIRRSTEAARADVLASEEDRRNVLVALLGDVGRYYANLRGNQLRLEIAEKNIAIAVDTVDLTRQRVKAGLATDRDVAQAEAQFEAVRAQVPAIDTSIQLSVHRLGVLLGEQPGAIAELVKHAPIPEVHRPVPTGLPSDLLERRPDIRRAEAQLAAATARVGEARADYFPRFTLLGAVGRQATQLHDLTLGLGNYFSFGPSVSLPVFTGGRIRSNVAIQDARVKEALAAYHAAILTAFEETENALVSFGNEQDRRDRLAATVHADETAFELANVQYTAGLTDFLTVLDAQREMYANQDLLAQSQTQVATNLIGLYKALGGGWTVSQSGQASSTGTEGSGNHQGGQ